MPLTHLHKRGVVQISGTDAATLLNGLVTNDVAKASREVAVFAAMLTPQGKYLFEMFVLSPQADTFLLDVSRPDDFAKRLSMYRLRSQVNIENMSDSLGVYAVLPNQADVIEGQIFDDPRMEALGKRIIAPLTGSGNDTAYTAHCLALGVPDPSVDLLVEKDFVMEGLFDELHGIDFHKGCYVGQEMTSRMKRRTSVKNKLCRVRYEGAAPAFETPIMADNWEVGRMRSGIEGIGIAMIRFDRAHKALDDGHTLMAGETNIKLDPPDWLVLPQISSTPSPSP